MSQLRLLLKIQVLSLFDINKRLHSGKQAMAGIVAVALAALILVALVVAYTVTIAQSLVVFELANYIPLLAFALAVTIVIFPTFLKANGTLFALKDFDQIISMPIPVRTVVLSRLIPLFAINVAISAAIIVPMMTVYFTEGFAGASGLPGVIEVIFLVIAVILMPMIPMILATLFAAAIAFVSARFRYANLVMSGILMLALVALVIASFGFSSAPDGNNALLMVDGQIFDALGGIYPPAAWAASGITAGDTSAFFAFVVLSVFLAIVAIFVLSRIFVPVNQRLMAIKSRPSSATSRGGRARIVKQRSPLYAFMAKEMRLLISTPIYFLNSCMGYALALAICALAAIATVMGSSPVSMLPAEFSPVIALFIPWLLALIVGMTSPTSASVSLEGKARWLMFTAPASTRVTLGAKLVLTLVLIVPTSLICATLLAFAFGFGIAEALIIALCSLSAGGLSATLGLALDAHRPNFSWTSPYEPVKRGLPVMVSILLSMIFVIVGMVATIFLGQIGELLVIAVGIVASIMLWRDVATMETIA